MMTEVRLTLALDPRWDLFCPVCEEFLVQACLPPGRVGMPKPIAVVRQCLLPSHCLEEDTETWPSWLPAQCSSHHTYSTVLLSIIQLC